MSRRKERQRAARQDYNSTRARAASWLTLHQQNCRQCKTGEPCRLTITAKLRGLLGAAGERIKL